MRGQRTVNKFFDQEWEKLKKLPAHDRVVRSLMERERRFPSRATSEIERQFRVTWPQQIEADLIKTSMVKLGEVLEDRGMKARLVMMIHDSIWIEAPAAEGTEVRKLMRTFMTETGKLDVPLEIDFE
jgi:DNA polymerase-1